MKFVICDLDGTLCDCSDRRELGDIFLKKFEFKDFCCWALKNKEFLIFLN